MDNDDYSFAFKVGVVELDGFKPNILPGQEIGGTGSGCCSCTGGQLNIAICFGLPGMNLFFCNP